MIGLCKLTAIQAWIYPKEVTRYAMFYVADFGHNVPYTREDAKIHSSPIGWSHNYYLLMDRCKLVMRGDLR